MHQIVVQEGQDLFNQWRSRIQRQTVLNSGLNLAHYLALRRHGLRLLQAA
jgi:pyruvate kinase